MFIKILILLILILITIFLNTNEHFKGTRNTSSSGGNNAKAQAAAAAKAKAQAKAKAAAAAAKQEQDTLNNIILLNKKLDIIEKKLKKYINEKKTDLNKLEKNGNWMDNYYQEIAVPDSVPRQKLNYKYGKDTSNKISNETQSSLNNFNNQHRDNYNKALASGNDYVLDTSKTSNVVPSSSSMNNFLGNVGIKDAGIPSSGNANLDDYNKSTEKKGSSKGRRNLNVGAYS